MRNLALYDNLTGLPNRMMLDDRIAQAASRAARGGKSFALISDTVARTGGGEFVVVLSEIRDPNDAAMYHAKRNGRNNCRFFVTEMSTAAPGDGR